ncbi:MAG: hypothetical protein M3447_09265 [Acidobacteriota bacterium]|nr:hypothetical protein [Acidobacteriota bacterium]
MGDIIGIGFIALLVLAGLLGLLQLSKPYEVSNEEFEKRAHEAPSLMSAGLSGLQKLLDPAAGKAMEVQEDLKQGYYNGEQESGDKPEPGSGGSKQEAEGSTEEAEKEG